MSLYVGHSILVIQMVRYILVKLDFGIVNQFLNIDNIATQLGSDGRAVRGDVYECAEVHL